MSEVNLNLNGANIVNNAQSAGEASKTEAGGVVKIAGSVWTAAEGVATSVGEGVAGVADGVADVVSAAGRVVSSIVQAPFIAVRVVKDAISGAISQSDASEQDTNVSSGAVVSDANDNAAGTATAKELDNVCIDKQTSKPLTRNQFLPTPPVPPTPDADTTVPFIDPADFNAGTPPVDVS